ncbi:MAG: hypothetical protein E7517_07415 [Ruminococcaceae bacterium]|nr:hypothetical protein [Oscillospiraceae bacterium]
MARKTIFEIVKNNSDLEKDIERIDDIVFNDKCVRYGFSSYTIHEFIDNELFQNWKGRGHCVDLDDFISCLQYDENFKKAKTTGDSEPVLLVIELCYNLWTMMNNCIIEHEYEVKATGNYYHVKNIMDDCLAKLNYTTHYDEEKEQLIVSEDNPATTAVAEIVEDDLAIELIRYNHYALKGDIKEKQRILKIMSDALEAKRDDLKRVDNALDRDVHFLINNINVRHNNVTEGSSSYKAYVANLTADELEEWYDETYQMLLFAFLRLDNIDRAKKVKELKSKLAEKENE